MRKIVAILISLLTAGALHADNVHYVITGNVDAADGDAVVLSGYNIRKTIAKTKVLNKSFTFEGDYPREAFARIDCGRNYANFIFVADTIVIDFEQHRAASGGELNEKYGDYRRTTKNLYAAADSIKADLQAKGLDETAAMNAFKENFTPLLAKHKEMQKAIILDNPNGLGEAVLQDYQQDCTFEEWDSLYALMPAPLKELKVTTETTERLDKMRKTQVGCMFLDIEGQNLDGTAAKLSDYVGKGKYVLVDFWASWCGPCRQEAKETLMPLYEKIKDDDRIMILGVATWEEAGKTTEALKTLGYKWQQIIGAGMTPLKQYGFNGIPMIMLFSPEGRIIARDIRGANIISAVEEALK